jgi:tetratricopeptide (TPR) repeat protein
MLADAHNVLGTVKQGEWDYAGAEQEYRRAIELNHSYAVAHVSYAMHLYCMQRFEEAAAEARRAQQLVRANRLCVSVPVPPDVDAGVVCFHNNLRQITKLHRARIPLEADGGVNAMFDNFADYSANAAPAETTS